ncbi:hypothetical protein MMC08_002290 [Hypocenomyce scalaris]|nr:hypothetical protein [Hypocenomyce scalaris]
MTRLQPGMRTGRQALWCQAAAALLTEAILLPPLGMQAADENLRRDLLPHVEHVQKRQAEIRERTSMNQRSKWFWTVRPQFSRREALQMAKYSVVYMQSGLWKESEELLTNVRDFVCGVRGMDHPISIRIQLALSETYWQQGRGLEAADLQEKVLQACLISLGTDDQKTLQVMSALARSNWMQGRYKPALELSRNSKEDVLRDVIQKCESMPTARNGEHPDHLVAEFYLLHCYRLQNRIADATAVCVNIINGLTSIRGENHPFMTHMMQTQEALRDPEKMTGSLSTTWMVI